MTKNILCTRRRLHRIVHPYGLISIFGENDLAGPPKVSASHMATGRGLGPDLGFPDSRSRLNTLRLAIYLNRLQRKLFNSVEIALSLDNLAMSGAHNN